MSIQDGGWHKMQTIDVNVLMKYEWPFVGALIATVNNSYADYKSGLESSCSLRFNLPLFNSKRSQQLLRWKLLMVITVRHGEDLFSCFFPNNRNRPKLNWGISSIPMWLCASSRTDSLLDLIQQRNISLCNCDRCEFM